MLTGHRKEGCAGLLTMLENCLRVFPENFPKTDPSITRQHRSEQF
jgi:hypothetical protein